MSTKSFEAFGAIAQSGLSETEKVGRLPIQREAERRIVPDVKAKLDLRVDDSLLEIGCGPGNILIPLSFLVAESVGIDHEGCIEAMNARYRDPSLSGVAGNFLTLDLDRAFSKVLIYSVLHYLADEDEVIRFVERAYALLKPGGRLLIGDIPNRDCQARFSQSDAGQAFNREWTERVRSQGDRAEAKALFQDIREDSDMATFGDAQVLNIVARLRQNGAQAFILPQPTDLPFGHTREDILVIRP
jgi:SAM-dependent methyltransferase